MNLFGVEPPSQTCTGRSPLASRRRRSECRGRDAKCASNAPLSSRSGRIASGITWRRRRGAVLGSPHARTEGPAIVTRSVNRVSSGPAIVTRSVNRVAPKVSPKMVGPLLRGNERGPRRKYFRWGKLGGNPQEGGNNAPMLGEVTPIKLARTRRTLIRSVLDSHVSFSKTVSRAAQPNLHSGRLRPLLQVAARPLSAEQRRKSKKTRALTCERRIPPPVPGHQQVQVSA